MNTSATVTALPVSEPSEPAGEGVEADGGEGVGSPLSLPLSVGECRQFGFPLGEGFLDDAAVDAGELSPQFEDRFVQAGLDHQIAGLKHVFLVGGGDLSEAVQQAVQPAQRIRLGRFAELVGVDVGVAEFGQSRRPVQPPPSLRHRLFDLGVGGVG